jgi:hypothetical protein
VAKIQFTLPPETQQTQLRVLAEPDPGADWIAIRDFSFNLKRFGHGRRKRSSINDETRKLAAANMVYEEASRNT